MLYAFKSVTEYMGHTVGTFVKLMAEFIAIFPMNESIPGLVTVTWQSPRSPSGQSHPSSSCRSHTTCHTWEPSLRSEILH